MSNKKEDEFMVSEEAPEPDEQPEAKAGGLPVMVEMGQCDRWE